MFCAFEVPPEMSPKSWIAQTVSRDMFQRCDEVASRTLIITVWTPGTFLSGGSGLPHWGIRRSSPTVVPSHVASGSSSSSVVSCFSQRLSCFSRLEPADEAPEKKSVILALRKHPELVEPGATSCFSALPAWSVCWLSESTDRAGARPLQSRSWGDRGCVSSSESEIALWPSWEPPRGLRGSSSTIASELLGFGVGFNNHLSRVLLDSCCLEPILRWEVFVLTPRKPSVSAFVLEFMFLLVFPWSNVP